MYGEIVADMAVEWAVSTTNVGAKHSQCRQKIDTSVNVKINV